MTLSTIQNSFAAGEVSPSLFGRTDLKKYHAGASTMRNFWVNYRGGASSRAGLAYIGTCKQPGTSAPPRDIPFQFNINQGYALEFGDQYMRIKAQGAYVVESPKNITGANNTTPCQLTIVAHGYSVGDWIFVNDMQGMTELNGLAWIVNTVPDADHVTLKDLFGNAVSSTFFGVYTSGGTAERVYTVVAPYAAVDLPYLKFTQSADTMSLTCVNQVTGTEYAPYDLVRNGVNNWVFTKTNFSAAITAPTGLTAVAQSSTTISTFYSYVVTAIDAVTGDESVASTAVNIENNDISINAGSNTLTWSPVTGAKLYNVYQAIPSYSVPVPTGTSYGFIGYSYGTSFTDTNITPDFSRTPPTHNNPFARGAITGITITHSDTNLIQGGVSYVITTGTGTGFVAVPIVVGGLLVSFIIENSGSGYINADTIAINTNANGTYTFTTNPTGGKTIILNGITWSFVTGTPSGNQSKIGATLNDTLGNLAKGLNASSSGSLNVASYSLSAQSLVIIYKTTGAGGNAYTLAAGTYGGTVSGATLAGGTTGTTTATLVVGSQTGTFPSAVTYFQQRRGYANTQNQPDTYFFSQPASFKNFDLSTPSVDTDAVIGAPWAQQINGIQFMQPMPTGLIMLTGNGAWLLNGNGQAFTPSSQTAAAQAYNGCSAIVPPIVIDYDILYVQAKGSIVRDLAFNFYVGVYTGQDKTTLCDHLFNYHQILQWAWAEEPYKIVWALRNDGILLSLTWLKDQDVYGWAHHDTNGQFVSVCSITEPPVNALYTIVKRFVQNQWMYYSERMDNRNWQNAEECFCVDAGLAYPMTLPNATLTPAAATGTNNISSVNLIAGGSGYTAPVAVAIDPLGEGSGATFNITVTAGVITAISPIFEGQNYHEGSTIQITDPTGTGAVAQPIVTNNVVFSADGSVFSSGDVGSVIRLGNNNFPTTNTGLVVNGGGKAIITTFTSPTQVTANIVEDITAIIPNSGGQPTPAISGQWSLSVPTSTITGLNHLEGMTVSILGDGSVLPSQDVTNGAITLPHECSAIIVGLPYTCQLQTLYLDPEGQGTVQGARKNIGAVVVRLESSRGIEVGTNQLDQSTQPNNAPVEWTDLKPIKERNALVHAGTAIPLFTGDHYINVPAGWATQGQIAIQQKNPLPANVLAVVPNYIIGDTKSTT